MSSIHFGVAKAYSQSTSQYFHGLEVSYWPKKGLCFSYKGYRGPKIRFVCNRESFKLFTSFWRSSIIGLQNSTSSIWVSLGFTKVGTFCPLPLQMDDIKVVAMRWPFWPKMICLGFYFLDIFLLCMFNHDLLFDLEK